MPGQALKVYGIGREEKYTGEIRRLHMTFVSKSCIRGQAQI